MPSGVYVRKQEHLEKLKGRIPWNKGNKKSIERVCSICNNIFFVGGRGNKKLHGVYCSIKCANMLTQYRKGQVMASKGKKKPSITGEKNRNRKGGKSTENRKARTSLEMENRKRYCLERDNYTCQRTGEKGGKLEVHHIHNFADYPELRFDASNGITLTQKAHKEFHKIYGNKRNNIEQLKEYLYNNNNMSSPQQALLSYSSGGGAPVYATRNPSDKNANISLSGGNLVATATTTAWKSVRGTIGKSSGKWYREVTVGATGTDFMVGVGSGSATLANHVGFDANGWCYYSNSGVSAKYHSNVSLGYGAQYGGGVIISVYLDMDAGTVGFYRNGVDKGVAYTGLSGTIYPMVSPYANGASYTANFGATAFTYSPPSGFNSGLY